MRRLEYIAGSRQRGDMSHDIVITLVHGTYAKGAAWTKSDSIMCQALDNELRGLGAGSIHFRSFSWSGRNRHEDRRLAAAHLCQQVRRQFHEFPRALHYMIAHSHGGNVALRAALESHIVRERISGVVCIATPFLNLSKASKVLAILPRILNEAAELAFSFVALVAAIFYVLVSLIASSGQRKITIFAAAAIIILVSTGFAVMIHALLALDHPIESAGWLLALCSPWMSAYVCNVVDIVISMLGFAPVLAFAGFILKRGYHSAMDKEGPRLDAEQRRLLRRYSYLQPECKISKVRLLYLTSPLDEALAVLHGSWWMHALMGLLARLAAYFVALIGVVSLGVVLFSVDRIVRTSWIYGTSKYVMLAVLFSWAVSLLFCSLVIKLVAGLSSLTNPALDVSSPNRSLLIRTRATRHPGQFSGATGRRYGMWELIRGSGELLFHSRIYSYPVAIRHIAEWMFPRKVDYSDIA